MTTPDKDKVVETSAPEAYPNAGSSPSSETGVKAEAPAGTSNPAAGDGSVAEVLEAEIIEPGDGDANTADGDAADGASDAAIDGASDVVAEAEAILAGEELAKAKAEAAEWQDKYMRLHAEWDTYRRRTEEQRKAEKIRAAEKLVTNLLPVIDDFERTIDYATNNGENGLLGGVQAVHNKLLDVLAKDGVQVIDPKGEPFDALEAQAVAVVPNEDVYDETVADVYQKGYRLGAKVLRPAMVTVTTGGPVRPAE